MYKQAVVMACLGIVVITALAEGDAGAFVLEPVELEGFGETGNTGVSSLAAGEAACQGGFLKSLFGITEKREVLAAGTWNTREGGQVHASVDGGATWKRLGQAGWPGMRHFCISALGWHGGLLYAGTWSRERGAGLYRMPLEGEAWEEVTGNGFGDVNNERITCLCVYNGRLYAGCFNAVNGPGIWSSESGKQDSWTLVNELGWEDDSNSDVITLSVWDGWLYAGTETLRGEPAGAQIWRTVGQPEEGALMNWVQVSPPGFGNVRNQHIGGMATYRGRFYAGTWNGAEGLEVWSVSQPQEAPFQDWELAGSGGIQSKDSVMTMGLAVCDDHLFVGCRGKFRHEGDLLGDVTVRAASGGALYCTGDGTTWKRVAGERFLEPPYLGVDCLLAHGNRLYVGLFSLDRPGQIWACRKRE